MTTGIIVILGVIVSALISFKLIELGSLEDRDKYR